jgi:hypothetical protein
MEPQWFNKRPRHYRLSIARRDDRQFMAGLRLIGSIRHVSVEALLLLLRRATYADGLRGAWARLVNSLGREFGF